MDQEEKNGMLKAARENLRKIRLFIEEKLAETAESAAKIRENFGKLQASETLIQSKVLGNYERRTQELGSLYPSPYFVKCEIKFDDETVNRIFYFAKFSFPENSIFSWTAPAAVIRFEKPGKFSYGIPGYASRSGELFKKEHYVITDGKIIFMATESADSPRELIFQEYFSQRKTSFILPEIVEQMEKAQDKVIRAHPYGSFLISGPAGSGKTTLALHRVAYLVQSPDTAEKFPPEKIIVFVQDASTKEYFAELLPQLGIQNVLITTFPDWARKQLGLLEYSYVIRYGGDEKQKDIYEYGKSEALKKIRAVVPESDIFQMLQRAYIPFFSDEMIKLFLQQRKARVLDRFDLILLLKVRLEKNGGLTKAETVAKQLKGGKVKRTIIQTPLRYSLIILDEVQNYLPEQIRMLRTCMEGKNNSLVYVGDLAQQTQLCTIRDWQEAGENFIEERKVVLYKNYRSTRQIAEFIKSVGFEIEIPAGLRAGEPVREKAFVSKEEEIAEVLRVIEKDNNRMIGVLAKNREYLQDFENALPKSKNILIFTINEAQGVEFDVVFLVGMHSELFKNTHSQNNDFGQSLYTERARVNRDLLYVALTRAMNELYVFGSAKVSELIELNK